MKIENETPKPEFTPVTLAVTLESPLDVELFQALMGKNITVPEMIFKYDTTKRDELHHFMKACYNVLS